uniref:Uncharacterized protein n=1 Tax=viral metagenome TaxID=1070528 RepID=A0A6M3LPR3_9ZZZZ
MAMKHGKTIEQRQADNEDREAVKSERAKTRSMATLEARLAILEKKVLGVIR